MTFRQEFVFILRSVYVPGLIALAFAPHLWTLVGLSAVVVVLVVLMCAVRVARL